ncbi:hypothetical protein IHE31_08520 [Mycetohabitans rhizoxinica]|uniref:Uncharacterized protein n=1 Tax=Mycetohabitans rhizoxinica TaxID=412963 RepID=A0ABZ2Q1C5_9BURK|nr:hypothetical protein [Mycetohabitans sp. B2]MCF7695376.1 hypothetical protein [Mycetohabitans sp. B2]
MAACTPSLQPFQWGEIGLSQIVHINGIPQALALIGQDMAQLQLEV